MDYSRNGTINNYEGYSIPDSHTNENNSIDMIPCSHSTNYNLFMSSNNHLSLKLIFGKYISKRKPFIIKRILKNTNFGFYNITNWQNLSYLESKAGHEIINVEKRFDIVNAFGCSRYENGKQEKMKFASFLHTIRYDSIRSPLYYLTTQSSLDEDAILSAPIPSLTNREILLSPPLFDRLKLINCNLWMGVSIEGSTSGLHHDHHDNFYCLINGKKKIKLYSPLNALNMLTRGTIKMINRSGSIIYNEKNCLDMDSDQEIIFKSLRQDFFALTIKKKDYEYESCRANGGILINYVNTEKFLEEIGATVEKSLDLLSDSKISIINKYQRRTDFVKNRNKNTFQVTKNDRCCINLAPNFINKEFTKSCKKKMKNFCNFRFGEYPNCNSIEMTMDAGDILFLPVGWFHEVISCARVVGTPRTNTSDSKLDAHLEYVTNQNKIFDFYHVAFNYWFSPPTNSNLK